jgi:uncharacterized protein
MKLDKLLEKKLKNLRDYLVKLESAVVAFSGGVDSTFLLKVASDVIKDNLIAVTADSASFPKTELESAKKIATLLNVKHIVIKTNEMQDKKFVINDNNRCYHCKNELFKLISELANKINYKNILDGSNYEDINDYRPGMTAAKEWNVLSPLKETGFKKNDVRILSKEFGLPTWNKPSFACLASRIPYGTKITEELLEKIDRAESVIRSEGFNQVRVRHHGSIARIELAIENFNKILNHNVKNNIINQLKELGYLYVTLDLEGYKTGSINKAIAKNKNKKNKS